MGSNPIQVHQSPSHKPKGTKMENYAYTKKSVRRPVSEGPSGVRINFTNVSRTEAPSAVKWAFAKFPNAVMISFTY